MGGGNEAQDISRVHGQDRLSDQGGGSASDRRPNEEEVQKPEAEWPSETDRLRMPGLPQLACWRNAFEASQINRRSWPRGQSLHGFGSGHAETDPGIRAAKVFQEGEGWVQ